MIEALRAKFSDYEWEMVAHNEHRSIYQLKQAGLPALYVKHHHPCTPLARLRSSLRPLTEHAYRMYEALSQAGIGVPEVVLHHHAGTQSALVTRVVESGTPLSSLSRDQQLKVLLSVAGALLKAGFVHKELVARDVLIDHAGRPVLVDVSKAARHSGLARYDIVGSLARVISPYEVDDEQLKEILPEKYRHDPHLLLAIRMRALKFNRARARRLVRRSLKPGSFSETLKTPEYTGILRRGMAIDLDRVIMVHSKNIQEQKNVLKCQDKTQVSSVGEWCVKSYQRSRPFTTPYAIRAWKGILTLYFNGLPVPEPVAHVVFRDKSSLLITRMLDLPTLDKTLFHDYNNFPPDLRHGIPEQLGELIGRMHTLGIYHADLKACNILTDKDKLTFYLTDTDKVRQYRYLAEQRRIKNLIQIHLSIPKHVSRAFRMRFLKGYTKETREDAKVLFSKVWGLSRGMEIVYTTKMGDKFERWDQQRPENQAEQEET